MVMEKPGLLAGQWALVTGGSRGVAGLVALAGQDLGCSPT